MSPAATTAPKAGHVFVARQPILDRGRRVYGYELLFRPAPDAEAAVVDDQATARVISDALLAVGLDTLTDGRRAFVNISRRLLLDGIPAVLPPDKVVLELASDIEADREVIQACQELRRAGYSLAVDDFVLTEWTRDLVPLSDFLKVDFLRNSDVVTRANGATAAGGPKLIAKQIETMDTFEQAVKEGYTYFQGFFFGRPLITQARDVPGQQLAHLRLLRALNDPNLSVHQLEDLIKHDASLCYRILRTVNSAAFALHTQVDSIRQALILLGRDTVRRWASLWAFAGLSERSHSELVVMATTRARCCEILGESTGDDDLGSSGFLVGMCSLLDAILERPMAAVLANLPVGQDVRGALMGDSNPLRRILDCAVAYERGNWVLCLELARQAKIDPRLLPKAYADALRWTRELTRA